MSNNTEKTLYDPSFEPDNCGIGAIVGIHGKKVTKLSMMPLRLSKILNTDPERMRKERPAMASEYLLRFLISSLPVSA